MSEANGVLRNHYHPPGATIYIEKRLTNQSYRLFSQPHINDDDHHRQHVYALLNLKS